MSMSPEQAIQMLENVKRSAPDRLVAACNTVALETPEWARQALSRDKKLMSVIRDLNNRFEKLVQVVAVASGLTQPKNGVETKAPPAQGKTAPPVPEAAPAPAPQNGNGGAPSRRMNMDGSEMSSQDAALEDMMDAASEGMPPAGPA